MLRSIAFLSEVCRRLLLFNRAPAWIHHSWDLGFDYAAATSLYINIHIFFNCNYYVYTIDQQNKVEDSDTMRANPKNVTSI